MKIVINSLNAQQNKLQKRLDKISSLMTKLGYGTGNIELKHVNERDHLSLAISNIRSAIIHLNYID